MLELDDKSQPLDMSTLLPEEDETQMFFVAYDPSDSEDSVYTDSDEELVEGMNAQEYIAHLEQKLAALKQLKKEKTEQQQLLACSSSLLASTSQTTVNRDDVKVLLETSSVTPK